MTEPRPGEEIFGMTMITFPMLDGGHLLFYSIEALIGRPINQRFQGYAYKIGFVLILVLMALGIWNDFKTFNIL